MKKLRVQSPEVIMKHQQNTSISKNLFSFPKDKRFKN